MTVNYGMIIQINLMIKLNHHKLKIIFFLTNRKTLYHNVYEYDLPLFNPSECKFEFIQPEDCDFENPWKESFKQLVIYINFNQSINQSIDCFKTYYFD